MAIVDDLELPIERLQVTGPAVRGLENRKEDNNNSPATVEKFLEVYRPVKERVLEGLRSLASRSFA